LHRAETPPNTPQRARATARENDRNNRNLDSPEQRRIPHNPVFAPIAPLHFNNVPIPQVAPFPGYAIVQDDPFALPPGPAQMNGHQLIHQPPPVSLILFDFKLKLILKKKKTAI